MRNLFIIAFITCVLFGCKKDEVAVKYDVEISVDDLVYNNKQATISATISPNNQTVSRVDFYLDGNIEKTIFSEPYQFSSLLKDLKTGIHKATVLVTLSDNQVITSEKDFTFCVKLGDDYQGGVVIKLSDNSLNGVVASKFDLTGGTLGMYKYGAYNGNYGAYSMDDGLSNSLKFEGKFDSNYAANACLKIEYNGYNDWYLPALNELLLFENFRTALNFPIRGGGTFWSSTESETILQSAYSHSFGGSLGQPCDKQSLYYVRPIRKF
jgi:hypothetical protein